MAHSKLKVRAEMTEDEKNTVMDAQMKAAKIALRAEARQAEMIATYMAAAERYGDRIVEMIRKDAAIERRMVISISVSGSTARFMDYTKRLTGMHWGQQMDMVCALLKESIPNKWKPLDDDVQEYTLRNAEPLYQDTAPMFDDDEEVESAEELIAEIDRITAARNAKEKAKKKRR